MSNKNTNPVWRAVLRIPSNYLSLVAQEDDLLAPYKKLRDSVYNFAAEVNKICVKFFKESSLDYIPKEFIEFNKTILNSFIPSDTCESQIIMVSEKRWFDSYRWNIYSKLGSEDNYGRSTPLQELNKIYVEADKYYNQICLPEASLQLHKQYEKLKLYFDENYFDVFAEFDLKTFYLAGDYFENINNAQTWVEELYKELEKQRENSKIIKNKDIENEEKKFNAAKNLITSSLGDGYKNKIDLSKTIPLDSVKFFVFQNGLASKECSLSDLIQQQKNNCDE